MVSKRQGWIESRDDTKDHAGAREDHALQVLEHRAGFTNVFDLRKPVSGDYRKNHNKSTVIW